MLEYFNALDAKLLLEVNGWHTPALDQFFFWMSEKWIWIPLYAWLFILYYRNFPGKILYVILAVALLITLSDQVASGLLKNLVHRIRPCHVPGLAPKIHLVNGYCGGTYGFVSSHAANTFALASFFLLTLGKRYGLIAMLLFAWAFVVSLSRIYLGVHYPGDVIGGAVTGIIFAFFVAAVFRKATQK